MEHFIAEGMANYLNYVNQIHTQTRYPLAGIIF